MSYQVKQGNIFGRIGTGIGKGLSEQVPKEIESNRLSKAFQDLQGKTPTEQLTRLASIPGGLEKAAPYIPLLQQGNQREAFLNSARPDQNASVNTADSQIQNSTNPSAPVPEVSTKVNRGGLASTSEITKFKNKALQPPTQTQIDDLARKYINSGITQDVNEARNISRTELNQNLGAQQAALDKVQTDIGQRMALDLQKGGLGNFSDVSGEIQRDLLDQAKYLVSEKGLTPEAAGQEISKIITDLGKVATQTQTTGALSNLFSSSKEKTNALKTQRKEFEKYGYGELFDDLASSALGITPLQTASILDPLKNENVKKDLEKYKKGFKFDTVKLDEKDFDKLVKDIKPSDNLFSIASVMRDKMIDVSDFLSRISDMADEGKIALTDIQRRQTQKPVTNSILGDILFKIF